MPSNARPTQKDPENKLLWKFNRRRLEAEEIRDAMLAVSGALNPRMGGPSVIVPIDQELVNALYKPSQWAVTPDPTSTCARSIYLIAKRNLRCPSWRFSTRPTAGQLPTARIEHACAAGARAAERRLRQPAGGISGEEARSEAGPTPRSKSTWLIGWLRDARRTPRKCRWRLVF